MKTKIINLVGASGSGKTTIAKELDKLDNINVIQSYTTRPPREEGEWGHTFIEEYTISQRENNEFRFNFRRINSLGFLNIASSKDMIAYFNSYKSGHHYFATDDQVVRGKTNIYVVDPEGAKQVHRFYKDADVEVITIGIHEDRYKLINNLEKREGVSLKEVVSHLTVGDNRDYQELEEYKEYDKKVTERINKDKELFKVIKCDYMIKGSDNALEFIKEMIK